MGAALLVAHQDVLQPAPGFCLMQFVVDRQDRPAGVAKNVRHPVAMQGIHQGIGTADPDRAITGRGCGAGRYRRCG
jgi:hypothetical protein